MSYNTYEQRVDYNEHNKRYNDDSLSETPTNKKPRTNPKPDTIPTTLSMKSSKLRQPMNQAIIDVGYILSSGERIYYINSPWFNNNTVEVFTAVGDPDRKILFRASVLADKYDCATNKIGMYLQRRRHITGGLYQSTGFTNKIQGRTGLKSGGYFVSMEVCEAFAAHWLKQAQRHENKTEIDMVEEKYSTSQVAQYTVHKGNGEIITGDIELVGTSKNRHHSVESISSNSTPDYSIQNDHSSTSTDEPMDSIHTLDHSPHTNTVIQSPYMIKTTDISDDVYASHETHRLPSPSPIPSAHQYGYAQSADVIPNDYKQPIWSQLVQSQLQQYPISGKQSIDLQNHNSSGMSTGFYDNSPMYGASGSITQQNSLHVPMQLRPASISPFHMKESLDQCNSSLMLPAIPCRSPPPMTPLLIDNNYNQHHNYLSHNSSYHQKPSPAPVRLPGQSSHSHSHINHPQPTYQSYGSRTLLEQQLRHALEMELPIQSTAQSNQTVQGHQQNYSTPYQPQRSIQSTHTHPQAYRTLPAAELNLPQLNYPHSHIQHNAQHGDTYGHHSDPSHSTYQQHNDGPQNHKYNDYHNDTYAYNDQYTDHLMYNDLLSSQSTFQYGLTIEQVNQLRQSMSRNVRI